MKVLIAGGSGFIGQNLSFYFSKKKNCFTVSSYFKNKPQLKFKNIKYEKIDFRSKKNCIKFVKSFDLIVICAGYVFNQSLVNKKNIDKKIQDHLKINQNILDACKLNKIKKVIYLSSALGYPFSKFRLSEDDFFKGKVPNRYFAVGNMYRFLEKYLNNLKLNFVILRPGEIYGEFDNFNINSANSISKYLSYFILRRKKKIFVTNELVSKKSFLYVGDLCKVIYFFANKKKQYNTSFNISNTHPNNLLLIIKMVEKVIKQKILKIESKDKLKKYYRALSTKKISKVLKRKINSNFEFNIKKVVVFLNKYY